MSVKTLEKILKIYGVKIVRTNSPTQYDLPPDTYFLDSFGMAVNLHADLPGYNNTILYRPFTEPEFSLSD